eukprot:jgi/Galph1/5266/GphlegSOOS_G3990.1
MEIGRNTSCATENEGQVVSQKDELIQQLHQKKKEYEKLCSFLRSVQLNTSRQDGIPSLLPLGPFAYASGRLKPERGVLVLLGENYFAKVSLKHAENMARRRIAFIKKRLNELKGFIKEPNHLSHSSGDETETIHQLVDSLKKKLDLLEANLQSTGIVNICEAYSDWDSSEPIQVHGLGKNFETMKQEMSEEDVDWNSLLDMTSTVHNNQSIQESEKQDIWQVLKELEEAESKENDDRNPFLKTTEQASLEASSLTHAPPKDKAVRR